MVCNSIESGIALLERAREAGQPDVYAGKRQWTRYRLGMRVEATTDPTRKSASWFVNIHDVSGGGIGFWSRCKLPVASAVWIRDCESDADKPQWLRGRVTHCSIGMRGHLIGMALDEATAPDSHEPPPLKMIDPSLEESLPIRTSGRLESLQTKCIYATIIAVSAAIALTFVFSQDFFPGLPREASVVIAIAAALMTGALCGWFIARQESRFLQQLHNAIRAVASGNLDSCCVIDAPCSELAAIGRAFNDLWARWKQRQHGERLQRQKLEELARIKTNILSIVSHDLRTPLTSILMYTSILMDEDADFDGEEQKSFLRIVNDECIRLSRLVDDILEVQRLESDSMRMTLGACDLAPTIRSCVRVFEPVAKNKSIALTLECPDALPTVQADPDRMSQVINNLVANALKYTPAQGVVHVTAGDRGKEVIIRVSDNGPGIMRDDWDHIYDRFSQVNDPNVSEVAGVGLGLYIVRSIVENHGGTTWVDSKLGDGSAFFVTLPFDGEPIRVPQRPIDGLENGRCVVAVCDSDPELLATIAHALRSQGFEVRMAHSGRRLLHHLEQGAVDVVVTDTLVPDMNSMDLLNALNTLPQRTFRTIIHSYEGDAKGYSRRGVDVFLRRPVSRDELVEAVNVALRRRSTAGVTIVIVQDAAIDVDRLNRVLGDAGHYVMVTGNVEECASLARKYSGDVVVVSEITASDRRGDLLRMKQKLGPEVTIVVLAAADRVKQFNLGDELGAVAAPYKPGTEENVVDLICSLRREQPVEASA